MPYAGNQRGMSAEEEPTPLAETLVRQYFDALRAGRIVDALDVFATDAILRDAQGGVHRGIREIAATFVHTREPRRIEIVALSRDRDRVIATVEIRAKGVKRPLRFRDVFHIDGQRVRSLTVAPVRSRTAPRRASITPRSLPA